VRWSEVAESRWGEDFRLCREEAVVVQDGGGVRGSRGGGGHSMRMSPTVESQGGGATMKKTEARSHNPPRDRGSFKKSQRKIQSPPFLIFLKKRPLARLLLKA
jgi:hypothetical protein